MGDSEEENELVGIQDELKSGGVFEDLPWEILKMVLENLPKKEIRKTRRLSRWYEKKVTELFPSIFCSFNIKFLKNRNKYNENDNYNADIITTLGRAMRKPHNKSNTLKIHVEIKQNPLSQEMLMSYQKSIVSLDMCIHGDEGFLNKPSLQFDLLESLSVFVLYGCQENFTESLIVKHASKLKKLSVIDCSHMIDMIDVPALPCLESLTVCALSPDIAWSLFRASKQTLTSLNITNITMNTQSTINNVGDENEADSIYHVPNLENLVISGGVSTKFLKHNANHLVSLTLECVNLESELPELPQLRELNITSNEQGDENLTLLLPKCKESLQCLVISFDEDGLSFPTLDDIAVTMPQLKAIYLYNRDVQCYKFLSYNHKSLEFIFLQYVDINNITLDDGVKFERVKIVVFGDAYHVYTEEDRAKMAEICPNAEILIREKENAIVLKDLVMSNHRMMGFTTDLTRIFYEDDLNAFNENIDFY